MALRSKSSGICGQTTRGLIGISQPLTGTHMDHDAGVSIDFADIHTVKLYARVFSFVKMVTRSDPIHES